MKWVKRKEYKNILKHYSGRKSQEIRKEKEMKPNKKLERMTVPRQI